MSSTSSPSSDHSAVAALEESPYHRAMGTPAIDIDKLAPEERLRLIAELWESLRRAPEDVPLTPAQAAKLDQRLDELDQCDVSLVSWDEVKRRLTARLG